ncbi:hypothetical protein ACIPY3_03160 [Paenarthrobacter sp. NPDC089714]|uniref:hypothetical protein n=1 Tax=Paenarthrobacter sp. NPDC089714 TaxID=3364377 RepID=UPI00381654A3
MGYREAIDLVNRLRTEMGSHLFASMSGWSFAMDRESFYGALLLTKVHNALSSKGDAPLRLPWPWDAQETPEAEKVTTEEREQLTAELKQSSAFGQLRT